MTRIHLTTLLLATGVLGGCAPKVPMELAQARAAYERAADGPAAKLVPAELHNARVALDEAQVAFEDDPKGYHTLDLAYVAQRKAELAETLAVKATSEKSTAASMASYQETQDAIMQRTRTELGESQADLAASQTAMAATSASLTASEAARVKAERNAADAMATLARLAAIKEETRGLVVTLSGSVLFRSDEAVLLSTAQTRLGQVADALMATKERSLVIEGHTDSLGTDEHNLDLSRRRAEAVRDFLTTRGYDATRVRAVGIGEARPIADNDTAEGRANNRRVEIVVEHSSTASQ